MQIRLRSTGQVMYESEFRAYTKANGGPSWETTTTEVLEALGADVVLEGPQATGGDHYQYSEYSGVEQIDGKWYTKYVLGPIFTDTPAIKDIPAKTASENEAAYKAQKDAEQAKSVREERNKKLSECDWTQVADALVDKAVWATYRQELRDLTKQTGFPWEVTWPTQP
jgi:hypothetical protein